MKLNQKKATDELLELLKYEGEPDSKIKRVQELLKVHHADARAMDNYPMHLAAKNGLTTIGKILLQYGATLEGQYGSHQPLYIAVWYGRTDFCEMLIDKGANVNVGDSLDNESLLHLAVKQGRPEVCQVLLKASNIYVDCQDSDGITPLILAMQEGNWSACRLLLEAGAKTDIVSKKGFVFTNSSKANALLEEMKKEGWTLHEGRMEWPATMAKSIPEIAPVTTAPEPTQEAVPTQVKQLQEIRERFKQFERPDELGRDNLGSVR